MVLGLSLANFTLLHVAISLVAIVAGLVAMVGLLTSNPLRGWTALFLVTTILTSVTGFFFPVKQLLPSHIVGIISLVVLAICCGARYSFRMHGQWRWIYVVTALIAQYLNVFVLVVQMFQKIPALKAMAPTQSEPPFLIAQTVVLVLFVYAGFRAAMRYRPPTMVVS